MRACIAYISFINQIEDENALNLIIDIGNTMAKVALFNVGEMVEVLTESNQSLGCLKALCSKYPIEQGIVATVIGHSSPGINHCQL